MSSFTALLMHAGERVRQRRFALGLKPSQIERLSNSLAVRLRDPRCSISHSTLAEIEAGSIPSVYKMLSLAYCLRLTDLHILDWYGIDMYLVRSVLQERASAISTEQQLTAHAGQHDLQFPFAWPEEPAPPKTEFLSPSLLTSELAQDKRFRHARIGSKDASMMEVVPRGSLVRIDTQQRKVPVFDWKSLWHRPIYFVWHPFGHCCRWCQQNGNELILIPHPGSRDPISSYRMPQEVTILGRVVSIWTSRNELAIDLPDGS